MYQVARQAGVSIATVSRVINGGDPVAPLTRDRVTDAIAALGYQPNSLARSLAKGRTHTLALLLPDITNPFFPELVKGVEVVADEGGYTLILAETGGDPAKEASYLAMLRGKQVEGVIAVGLTLKGSQIEPIIGPDLPVVCLDRGTDLRRASTVHIDHRQGARLATQHLVELGHRRIAHIAGPPGLELSAQRCQGYQLALEAAEIVPAAAAVIAADLTESGGYDAMERLLQGVQVPTAVFVANDLMAIGAMAALKANGITVPDEISVVGFDDIKLAAYTYPPLTTIHQPIREMARAGSGILLTAIRTKSAAPRRHDVIFEGTLVVRQSTAPPPSLEDKPRPSKPRGASRSAPLARRAKNGSNGPVPK